MRPKVAPGEKAGGMGTIRIRFITVALVVSFFAIGMAAFLNYFKYKSTISNIVKSRVLLVAGGIETSVQASLQIGMQFAELSQLPQLLQREKTTDRVIRGIDVFDAAGQVLYSSDAQRVGAKVPETWLESARQSKELEWGSTDGDEYVAGVTLKNAFNLTMGYIGLRYSREEVERATKTAGREIMLAALGAFLGISILAPLALIVVIRRFERDLQMLDAATTHLEERHPKAEYAPGGAFADAITSLRKSLRAANEALDDVRAKLDSADGTRAR